MASLLARNMVTIGVAGAYMTGTFGGAVMATTPLSTGNLPADGVADALAAAKELSGNGRLDNQLGMIPNLERLGDAADEIDEIVGVSDDTVKALAEAAEAAEAETDEYRLRDDNDALEEPSENDEMPQGQMLAMLGRFGLVDTDAQLVAGLFKFEEELFAGTGALHDEALESLAEGIPTAIKQKLREIEAQIASRLDGEGSVAAQLLEGVTLGQILASLPKNVDPEPILAMLRNIILPDGSQVDPEVALEKLKVILAGLENGRMNDAPLEPSTEQMSGSGSSANEGNVAAEDDQMRTKMISAIEQSYRLDVSDAEMMAGLIEFQKTLIFKTGPKHDEVIEEFGQVVGSSTFVQIKPKLRSIKAKIMSAPAAPMKTEMLEVLTIGEILVSIPEGVDAESIFSSVKQIVMEGTRANPETALFELEQLLGELTVPDSMPSTVESDSMSSTVEPDSMSSTVEPETPEPLGAHRQVSEWATTYGLSTVDAELLYGVLELETRVFGAEGLDHDEAEKLVLGSSGSPEFAHAFHRLRQIEGTLQRAPAVDQDLLEAVVVAEIMLKLPAGENGKQMMSAIRAMVTTGQLSYKQVMQLRDSLPDPVLRQPLSETQPPSSSSAATTVSTDEAAPPTEEDEIAPASTTVDEKAPAAREDPPVVIQPTEKEVAQASTGTADEKAPAASTSDEVPEDEGNDADEEALAVSELEADESKAADKDTGSGLSDQNIIIITAVSILMLLVAGVVTVMAVRRSRRRSNAAKKVTTSVDPLPAPPISSTYEHTAVVVDEEVYSDQTLV